MIQWQVFIVVMILIFQLIQARSGPPNEQVSINCIQNNPGDPIGWQQTILGRPDLNVFWNFTGQSITGENSGLLTVDFLSTGYDFFPTGSPQRAWLLRMRQGIHSYIAKQKAHGLKVYFSTDLLMFPSALVRQYSSEIVNPTTGTLEFNAASAHLMTLMFDELFALYPLVDGLIVRTGETYVYDLPYHQGNSPIAGVTGAAAQLELWVSFIDSLRTNVCVKHGRAVIFRTWDSFGEGSPASYYAEVTDAVAPHELLYFSLKHTAGDFFRFMPFNPQLGVGVHAQVIEVELQREYEGKGAYANYVLDAVINGDVSAPGPHTGLAALLKSTNLIRGIWTWSRGGGWWGPYLKGREFWPTFHMCVMSQWWQLAGARSEEQVFLDCCESLLPWDAARCASFRQIALLSSEAILNGRYCPEGDNYYCYLWSRDDRLGGLYELSGHFDFVAGKNLFNASLSYKRQSVEQWRQIEARLASLLAAPSAQPLLAARRLTRVPPAIDPSAFVDDLAASVEYGSRLFRIVEAGWRVLACGYMLDHNLGNSTLLRIAIKDGIATYDEEWAGYKAFALISPGASLYQGIYFNLPGYAAAPGMDASVDLYRNITFPLNQ